MKDVARRRFPRPVYDWGLKVAMARRRRLLRKRPVVSYWGRPFALRTDDIGISWYLLRRGAFDAGLIADCLELIEPGAVVVDVGANLGLFTVPFALRVGSKGQVIAFEPEPISAALLRSNVESSPALENVAILTFGLSKTDAEADLFLAADNMGAHSLGLGAVPTAGATLRIRLRRLDDVVRELKVRRVDFVKMDVQGAEPLVIEGAQDTIRRHRPVIALEYSHQMTAACGADGPQMFAFLESLDYRLQVVDPDTGAQEEHSTADVLRIGQTLELNILAIPSPTTGKGRP